jgi:hypothetical protein
MSLGKMVADSEGKSQIAFTTPAAASVTVATDELALWISIPVGWLRQVEIYDEVVSMLETLREAGTPTSTTDTYTTIIVDLSKGYVDKNSMVVDVDQAFAIPTDQTIQIYIGELFQPLPGSSVTTAIKRLWETWLEQVGKKL